MKNMSGKAEKKSGSTEKKNRGAGRRAARIARKREHDRLLRRYGGDILDFANMRLEKNWMQHGKVSVFAHSVRVALLSLWLAELLHLQVDRRAMLRGALLHDYFLYDWHDKDPSHRWHGFHHADVALKNARRDFVLGEIEENIIWTHMFPLNLRFPRYRESALVCIADKISALEETLWNR